MPLKYKHTGASFSPSSTDSLPLQLTQVPRSPDLAIFVSMTMTEPITLPLERVCGVIRCGLTIGKVVVIFSVSKICHTAGREQELTNNTA